MTLILTPSTNISQVEHFGMHLHAEGNVVYGISIEAILDRDSTSSCNTHLLFNEPINTSS